MHCKMVLLWILCQLFTFAVVDQSAAVTAFDVTDFGAVGDGKTKDTAAIQAAIDSCAEAGGKVVLPAGTFLSGTLYLKSGVTLYLSNGALLLGSADISDYPANKGGFPSYTDSWLTQSLIFAQKQDHISICGEGIIDGQGGRFAVTTKKKPDRYKNRPYIIRFIGCRDVRIQGITLRNSAMWMQHYLACERIRIQGITVYNHCNKNNDMIDIDGCRDVIISDCIGDSDDDALTLKSTSARPTENVTISNCILSSHCNAIKMGTESHGGFKNIVITNCLIKPSRHDGLIYGRKQGLAGIVMAIVDGGSLHGVTVSNIRIIGTTVPLYLRLGDRGRIYKTDMQRPDVGTFSRVNISNIIATGTDSLGCSITGLPDRFIGNVSLSHIRIQFKGNGAAALRDQQVPELREHYPESTMFGALPAYGFYIRHVNDISLNDIHLETALPDYRPALYIDDVSAMQVSGLSTSNRQGDAEIIRVHNGRHILVSQCQPLTSHHLFLNVTGSHSKDILMQANLLSFIRNPLYIGAKANAGSIQNR